MNHHKKGLTCAPFALKVMFVVGHYNDPSKLLWEQKDKMTLHHLGNMGILIVVSENPCDVKMLVHIHH